MVHLQLTTEDGVVRVPARGAAQRDLIHAVAREMRRALPWYLRWTTGPILEAALTQAVRRVIEDAKDAARPRLGPT